MKLISNFVNKNIPMANILFNHETLNLPEELFETFKNVVFTDVVQTSVQFSQAVEQVFNYDGAGRRIPPFSGVVLKVKLTNPVTTKQGQYGLNMLKDNLHEMSFNYMGYINEKFTFVKPEIKFTFNSIEYTIPEESFVIFRENGKWVKQNKIVRKYVYNGKEYSFADIAKILKISEDELSTKLYRKEVGEERDPAKFITSMIPLIEKAGDHIYLNKTMINGELYDVFNHQGKITCYDKTCPGYVFRWIAYNDGLGNFGEVWKVNNLDRLSTKSTHIPVYNSLSPGYNSSEHLGQIDQTREHAVLELQMEELPAQGKNIMVSGYMDTKTSEVLTRLPRKPVE